METLPLATLPMHDEAIGGIPASELAALYGTPLHVIDTAELELEIDRFERAFGDRGITVGYAAKAFVCIGLAELIAQTRLRLDVCSLGELLTAERGGLTAERIYFHGCGKTAAELRAVVDGRVAFDVIDNVEELEHLAKLAAGGPPVDVMLRLNTGIEAHTHEYIRTGGENTKFGIGAADVGAVLGRLRELPQLRLIGLHSHIGSSIVDAAPFVDNLGLLIEQAAAARRLGHPITDLIAGGGLGVESIPGQPRPLDLDGLAEALAERARDTDYRIAIEPGRALIARAGSTLYRVMAVKRQGQRRFVIVDGGMADNPRPALYGAHHHLDVVHSAAVAAPEPATLCGRSCENDELGDVAVAADLRAGDLVALRTTGAYTYSMASNYNRFGRPPVVFVTDGSHRRVVRGEVAADVLRNDLG
jgi:diaminopimelate decarboxylase